MAAIHSTSTAQTALQVSSERPTSTSARDWQRFGWPRTLAMHLLPATITFGIALLIAPILRARHIPPDFSLTVAFAFVLTPIELGILLRAAHKATGRWSLRALPAIIAYRQPLRKWWFLIPFLFVIALALAIAWTPFENAIGGALNHHFPYWFLPSYDNTVGFSRPIVIVTMLLTLLIDGIVNPTVEELYFRGYLLPRLPIAGWSIVPIGAFLFAVQHYWQPFNWCLIFVLECILITLVLRARSVRLGIVMHMLANSFGTILALIGFLAK